MESPKINLWWSSPLGGAYCSFRCHIAGLWGAYLVFGLLFALISIYFVLFPLPPYGLDFGPFYIQIIASLFIIIGI
ncbi:MAG: hypothetical protein ACFFBD_19075 [Candidatus Hodarchaeota archaeon]